MTDGQIHKERMFVFEFMFVYVTQVFNDYSQHAVTPSTKQINFCRFQFILYVY